MFFKKCFLIGQFMSGHVGSTFKQSQDGIQSVEMCCANEEDYSKISHAESHFYGMILMLKQQHNSVENGRLYF